MVLIRTRAIVRALCLVLVALIAAPVFAQDAGHAEARGAAWQVGPYIGGSWHAPGGPFLGVTRDRRHLFLGVQLTGTFMRKGRWTVDYSPEVLPLLVVFNNPKYRRIDVARSGRVLVEDGRALVTGFGVSPFAFQVQRRIGTRWRAYASAAGGVVFFSREVPVLGSQALNYTVEFGGGVRWQAGARGAWRVGYKFHHLSNAYSAVQNPGLDAMVVLVGYERLLGRR